MLPLDHAIDLVQESYLAAWCIGNACVRTRRVAVNRPANLHIAVLCMVALEREIQWPPLALDVVAAAAAVVVE
jgi:hypothetical protein